MRITELPVLVALASFTVAGAAGGCSSDAPGCATDGDCQTGHVCEQATGSCVEQGGASASGSTAGSTGVGGAVGSGGSGGASTGLMLGATCTSGADCASGHCRDGVCCDGVCDGLCRSCLAAQTGGSDGLCEAVLASTDPDGECSELLAQCDGLGACGSCVAEQLPLHVQVNLFYLLERSNVSNVDFQDLKQTLGTFFNDANQTELGASLTFVPKDANGNGTGVAANSCNTDLYTPVHVGLQQVPTQASVLLSAMSGQSNSESTVAPLYGALYAVLSQATQHQDAHPERRVAVVLIGAGTPSGCAGNNLVDDLASLAQSAVDYNGVRTFTVAMPTSTIPNLDQIAAVGDTVQSYPSVVSSTDPLYAIEAKARGCTYPLPALAGNAPLDPARTNIEYTSGDASLPPALIPRASGKNDCGNQPGYYFDEPSNPTHTVFCPASCTALEGDTGAVLKLLHGCPAVSN